MKLLNTIQNIIKEAEEQYNNACDSCVPVEELDRLEKHYKDSLKFVSAVPILDTVRNLKTSSFKKQNVVDFKGETPCP